MNYWPKSLVYSGTTVGGTVHNGIGTGTNFYLTQTSPSKIYLMIPTKYMYFAEVRFSVVNSTTYKLTWAVQPTAVDKEVFNITHEIGSGAIATKLHWRQFALQNYGEILQNIIRSLHDSVQLTFLILLVVNWGVQWQQHRQQTYSIRGHTLPALWHLRDLNKDDINSSQCFSVTFLGL